MRVCWTRLPTLPLDAPPVGGSVAAHALLQSTCSSAVFSALALGRGTALVFPTGSPRQYILNAFSCCLPMPQKLLAHNRVLSKSLLPLAAV